MSSNKTIPIEAAYIAEELLQGSKFTDLDHKCIVIKQALQDGDFTLEEALHLYEATKADFESFIARHVIAELHATFAQTEPRKSQVILTIDVVAEIYRQLFSGFDKNSNNILRHFKTLSKEIEEDKVLV